jgi:hypothetical protein
VRIGTLIGQVLWLALPGVIAASVHMVVVKRGLFARLAVPIDGGRTLAGRRIFGDNKTWRGVLFVTLASALLGAFQGLAGGSFAERWGLSCIDARALGARLSGSSGLPGMVLAYTLIGGVLGFGYILGELPNSFAKRRLSIGPGDKASGLAGPIFFIADRCDSVIAALLLGALVFSYPLSIVLVGFVCLSLVHLALSAALHRARIKKSM